MLRTVLQSATLPDVQGTTYRALEEYTLRDLKKYVLEQLLDAPQIFLGYSYSYFAAFLYYVSRYGDTIITCSLFMLQ